MRLFQSQDQSRGFYRLTRVKSSPFFLFFSIRLSKSDSPGHGFGELTHVIF